MNDDTHFHTYKFYTPTNGAQTEFEEYHIYTDAGDYTTFTQVIKRASEGLVVPQLPSFRNSANSTFAGWYLDTGSGADIQTPTLSSTEFDFGHIPEVESNQEYHLYVRFANFAYVIFHEQYNGATHSWPITQTRRGELAGSGASVRIDDVKVSYDDSDEGGSGSGGGEEENTAPVMAFRGWTKEAGLNGEGTAAREDALLESSPIVISENTDLYPVFVHINWLTFISGPTGSGATYYPPEYKYVDETIASFSQYIPTRRGYTFAGWYADKDASGNGTGAQLSDASGALTTGTDLSGVDGLEWEAGALKLSKNVTIYAKWMPASSSHTIVIWRQKLNNSVNATDAEKTYDFAESFVINANTGSTATVANTYKQRSGGQYTGFYYRTCDADTTVAGNGTTVLNVYYDRYKMVFQFNRRDYTYTETTGTTGYQYGTDDGITYFRIYNRNGAWRRSENNDGAVYSGTRYTRGNNSNQWATNLKMTGLYGQMLSEWGYTWPSAYTWYNNYSGSSGSGTVITFLSAFNVLNYPQETLDNNTHTYTVNLYSTSGAGSRNIIHVLQDLEGNYSLSDPTLVVETKSSTGSFELTNKFEGFTVCGYSYSTFTSTPTVSGSAGDSATQNTSSTLYVYHRRNTYNLKFVDAYENGRTFSEATVYYGAPLAGYRPTTTPTSTRVGYQFTDWYNDYKPGGLSGSTKFDFTGTMPMANVIVYACWDTEWYLIQFDPNGGDYTGYSSYSTWTWKQYGTTELVREYENTTRNYIETLDGTWYYAVKDRAFYGLGDEWESREDDISERTACYTQDISDPAIVELGVIYSAALDAFRYASWYEVEYDSQGHEIGEHVYNFSTQITHSMTLRLHWKQVGTYYIRYDAGLGEMDDNDNNEVTFKVLDSADYADHSDVVVTRVARPPERYNFVGWTIRGDTSGTVYYPGEAFEFQSKYAVKDGDKDVLILDAVYTRASMATIIYDANGGAIGENPSFGAPAAVDAPPCTTSVGTGENGHAQATIANLVNNSAVELSSGADFTMERAVLMGWNTKPDATGTHFDLGQSVYVDTEEPITLYAEWKVKVYYDLNKDGNGYRKWPEAWTTDTHYTHAEENDRYYEEVYVGQTVSQPPYTPMSTNPTPEMFYFWYLERYDAAEDRQAFDFSTPITGETILFANWNTPVPIPVHAVDATVVDLSSTDADKDADWLVDGAATRIQVISGMDVALANKTDAGAYATHVPLGYTFAFACVGNSRADCSEETRIKKVYYNTVERTPYVTLMDDTNVPLGNKEIYLVYFQNPKTLDIGYKVMNTSGTLGTPTGLREGRPQTAIVGVSGAVAPDEGEYDMQSSVSRPRYYAYDDYAYYSYAIGARNATSASQLQLITTASGADNSRPALQVRNTWRGFQYSLDGGSTWVNCGYDIQLYVVYYQSQPTIVTLNEKTIGKAEDMSKEFTYTIRVVPVTVVQTQTETQSRSNGWDDWGLSTFGEWQDGTRTQGDDITSYTISLSDGEAESITLFSQSSISNGGWNYGQYGEIWSTNRTRTNTRTVVTQKVVITQASATTDGFATTNEGADGTSTSNLSCEYTAQESGGATEVLFINTRKPVSVPVHVALITGENYVNADATMRSGTEADYTLSFADLSAEVDLTEARLPNIFTDTSGDYGFAGVFYGTQDDEGKITLAGAVNDTHSVTYGLVSGTNIYETYLNGNASLRVHESELNQGYNIYFVYYKLPKIYYVLEDNSGNLTQISPIRRNGSAVTLNGDTVTQGARLDAGASGLTIAQSGAGSYGIPPDLDKTDAKPLFLDYVRLAAGPEYTSGMQTSALEAVTEGRVMSLRVENGRIEYTVDGGAN